MIRKYQTELAVAAIVVFCGALLIFVHGRAAQVARVSSASEPVKKWEFQFGEHVAGLSPALAPDGTIYVGTDAGLYALTPAGEVNWKSAYMKVTSAPLLAPDGTIYVTDLYGSLHAFNSDGSQLWPSGAAVGVAVYNTAPVLGDGGVIYIASGGISAFSAKDGSRLWQFKKYIGLAQLAQVGPGGLILMGAADGQFYAVQPNGEIAWSAGVRNAQAMGGAAVGADGTIYVGGDNGTLYAVFNDGKPRWEFKTSGPITTEPVIGEDGTIYVAGDKLYAINPDHTLKWSFDAGAKLIATPAIATDGTIYCSASNNKFYAVRADGTKKWEFTADGLVFFSPSIAPDDSVYVISSNNRMYAFAEANGGLMRSAWPRFQHDAQNTGNANLP